MIYPRLLIEHNHGFLLLANARITEGEAVGTVIDGATTSRLFHVTSTTRDKPGTEGRRFVWREPYHVASRGHSEDGRWVEHPTPGEFRVSCVSCG